MLLDDLLLIQLTQVLTILNVVIRRRCPDLIRSDSSSRAVPIDFFSKFT